MDQEFELIYRCVRRARNNFFLGMFFVLAVGIGMSVGSIMSEEMSIGILIFGLFCTLLGVFGFVKIVAPIMNPYKAPVVGLLQNNPGKVKRIYMENISSGAMGLSRTIQQLHVLDTDGGDHTLGVKKKYLDDTVALLKKLAPQAKWGWDPEAMKKE